ncbi:MAG TPA: Uma2 family endonuclease [Planctomycetota bacterium]|nr:Uma2 family endonuclease [Planctomycetota bacterium]
MNTATLITAEQLLEMPENRWSELVAGELREMTPPSCLHASVISRLDRLLGNHVEKHKLGAVLAGDPGFVVARDPDTVLGPDIAFIRAERLAAEPLGEGFREGAPDLAVEILSPGQAPREGHEKALAWLDAGAALVWVVNPARRTVTVYRSATDIETLPPTAELDGAPLLPGFRCPIADLFVNP